MDGRSGDRQSSVVSEQEGQRKRKKTLDTGEWMELFLFAYLEDETEIHHRRPNNRSMHVAYLFFSHIIVDDGHRW